MGSKADLVALAGDQLWNGIALPDLTTIDWRTAATQMATDLYIMLARHQWLVQAFGPCASFGPAKARHDNHLLAIYEAVGLTGARADRAAAAVYTFALGGVVGLAAPVPLTRKIGRNSGAPEALMRDSVAKGREVATRPTNLQAHLETAGAAYSAAPEQTFAFGLKAILDGLEAQLITRGDPPDYIV